MADPFLDALTVVRGGSKDETPADPFLTALQEVRDPTLAQRVVRTGLRVGGAVLGGLGGAAIGGTMGAPAGPAGIAAGAFKGGIVGGGLGAGLGELGAEYLESQPGRGRVRESINPYQVAAQTALGAIPIPGAKPGVGFLRAAITQAPKGVVLGGSANVATSLAEGQAPTLRGVAESAALGGLIGGAAGGVFRPRAPQPPPPSPPRGFLRSGPSFVANEAGQVGRPGEVIPMVKAPDGSYVRGVPAEYARHEIRGLLPAGPRFIADASGGVAPLADAADAFGAALTAVRAQAPRVAPDAPDASGVRAIPAAIADREFDAGQVARKIFSSDPSATDAPLVNLNDAEAHELRRMLEELKAWQFTPRSFVEQNRHGGTMEVVAGAGGAPVYSDVIAPLNYRPTRTQVENAIADVLAGRSSVLGQNAIDVARLRLAGSRDVSRPFLPPDAGDLRPAASAEPELTVNEFAQALAKEGETPIADVPFALQPQAAQRTAAQPSMFGSGLPRTEPMGGRRALSAGEEHGINELDALQRAIHGEDAPTIGNGTYRPDDADFDAFSRAVDELAKGAAADEGTILSAFGAGQGRTLLRIARENPAFAVRLVTSAIGGVTGAALPGEDASIEDRILAGVVGAGAGYAGGRLLTGAGRGPRLQTGTPAAASRGFLRTTMGGSVPGQRVPPAGPIPPNRLQTMPILTDDVQRAADDLLEQYGGFERQRRGVQSVDRTEGLADRIQVDPTQPLKPGTAFNAERLRAYQNATATILAKQKQLSERVKAGTATPAEQLELERARTEATILTANFRGAAAEAGRALHILRYQAKILQTGDTELIREAVQASQRGLKADLLAYYYSNILSGAATHERNVLGNLSNAVFNLAAHPLAVGADVVRSAATGQERQVFIGELPERVAGSIAALPRAFSNMMRTLRTGIPGGEVTSFDRPVRAEFRGGGANPFNYPGRLLDAVDDFFVTVAGDQVLYAAAFAQAKREGFSGSQLLARAARLKVDPSDDILREVQSQRARLVFREDPGDLAKAILSAKRHVPALGYVLPFVRVPSNIIRQGFEASPAGFAMKSARQGGRAGADAMGRAALGSLLLTPLAYWTALGKITGDAPRDPAKRAAFFESGKRPNSIQIGDTWYNYQTIQPLNVPLSLIANGFNVWQEAKQDSETTADEIARDAVLRTAGSLLDQSFLSGLSALVDALGDPGRYGARWLEQTAQGFVPFSSALRTTTQTMDPTVRAPRGLAESVQAILPGQSDTLQPRLTRFGEPVQRDAPLNVFRPSRVLRDPVADALAAADVNLRPAAGPARVELGRFVPPLPLSGAQRTTVGQASGRAVRQMLERVIATPEYQRATPQGQQYLLQRAITEARGGVNEQVRREALMQQMQGTAAR